MPTADPTDTQVASCEVFAGDLVRDVKALDGREVALSVMSENEPDSVGAIRLPKRLVHVVGSRLSR
jgi:hypothetical protein